MGNQVYSDFHEVNFQPLRFDVAIPSKIAHLELVDQLVRHVLGRYRMDESERDYTGLAVHEVVANAIVHGNKKNPDRFVQISFYLMKDCLRIEVTDEGEGFDPGKLPDPTDPANLLKPHGRGLLYVRKFVENIKFEKIPTGMKVILEKKAQINDN